MSFAWPYVLLLLVAPLGLLAWELTRRRGVVGPLHPKILRAEAGQHSLTLRPAAPAAPLPGRGARPWLCLGLACAIVALARPQWGRLEEPVFDQSREIVLAVDLSRSMLTTDVKPSRLDRSKLLIESLLEKLAGERVGLVVFSGTAFLQSPMSSDYEILREFLPALGPDFLPEGGSNYGAMLETAVQAFGAGGTADRFLIVLSDGESTDAEWKARIEELKKKSIRVMGLGIGTPVGAMIPDGSGGFVKDDRGAVVLSKLESSTLQELAESTGGVYRDASVWIDLATLVEQTIEAGRKGEFVEKNTVRLVERFQWPLALGLWCLFVSLCYEFPVRPRPRDIRLQPAVRPPTAGHVAALLLLVLSASLATYPQTGFAAATLAPPPAKAPAASPSETPALARIVGRIAEATAPVARDWAELARETVNWGSRIQSQNQPVPAGPVHDALQAVGLGEKLDGAVSDWPKLRKELEGLLKTPESQQQQDKSQQDEKNQQDQKNQDSDQDQKNRDEKDPQKESERSDQQKSDPSQNQKAQPPQQPSAGESAFGDMQQKGEPPPPPKGDTQKVGGSPEQKPPPEEARNPALAMPLQKLEQLRDQDSPARLFELMQGDDKAPPKKPNKDW